jgi:glycosyltransferase involved in cell wall biosynthesis
MLGMKVLFDHSQPFLLAHGGFQVQIEQTRAALQTAGVKVDFLRWWDASQSGELIHFFGLPPPSYAGLSQKKGIKIVVAHLLGGLGARSKGKRFIQRVILGGALRTLPEAALARLGWQIWQSADAYIAVTAWEARLMTEIFRVPHERVHVIPNGVSEFFFQQPTESRGKYLVTTASIFPVKRVVETAQAAVIAQTPYWIIGRPLSTDDAYYRDLLALCRNHPGILRYDGDVLIPQELASVYSQARGFVLLSRWETQSLSALEAAASGCPLLLSDLPWARSTFGQNASFCPITSITRTSRYLRKFYDEAPSLPPPAKPHTWADVAAMVRKVYEEVLTANR